MTDVNEETVAVELTAAEIVHIAEHMDGSEQSHAIAQKLKVAIADRFPSALLPPRYDDA